MLKYFDVVVEAGDKTLAEVIEALVGSPILLAASTFLLEVDRQGLALRPPLVP